ncbi:ATP-binding protein [Glutamicibacter sp.]|uniref:ATP-binding protein n=1 Tax=Glutamicibacter sp. TaxID=1931995 RepID=UPI002FE0BCA1
MYRLLHHQDHPLRFRLDLDEAEGNRFTVVLGPNGTGKSQLLRSIAESHRDRSAKSEIHSLDPFTDTYTGNAPSTLLVLSNMVTDVFVNTSRRRDSYRYLGLRQASNNTSTGALRDVTSAAILQCFMHTDGSNQLRPVLDAIGGEQFVVSFERPRARRKLTQGESEVVNKFLAGLELSDHRSHYASGEALLMELRDLDASVPRGSEMFDFDAPELVSFWNIAARFQLEAMDMIRILRRLGFANVRVHVQVGNRTVDLDTLSTGQLLLLSTFARVAAHVSPNSLVVIDEPEAGLHPNWQSAWIPLMRATIPTEYGCHLFIATHSPYLVSDADDVLVPGEEWGKFVQFEEPYQGRSVENILYRVFGARIAGNLMVEDDLRTLVQFISRDSPVPSVTQLERAEGALQRLRGMQGEDTEDLNLIIAQAEEELAR